MQDQIKEKADEIAQDYLSGKTFEYIMDKHKVSRNGVFYVLGMRSIEIRKRTSGFKSGDGFNAISIPAHFAKKINAFQEGFTYSKKGRNNEECFAMRCALSGEFGIVEDKLKLYLICKKINGGD